MMKRLKAGRFPKTYYAASDSLETSNSGWWCSGFYPGTLLYLYKETKDEALLTEANRILKVLEKEQYNTTTHDLGFMMYCSFGNALQIAPKPEYKQILINSAKSLSSRFDPKVGAIKSWDSKKQEYLVIIDNMMNLELLYRGAELTDDDELARRATEHAKTTIAHHIRPDDSTYHLVNYNPATGAVQGRYTVQGFADNSTWARGQSWGVYGYTTAYKHTKDPQFNFKR